MRMTRNNNLSSFQPYKNLTIEDEISEISFQTAPQRQSIDSQQSGGLDKPLNVTTISQESDEYEQERLNQFKEIKTLEREFETSKKYAKLIRFKI